MVDWDSVERGITFGHCRDLRGVYLSCTACRRWVGVEIAEAVRAFGADTHLGDVAKRLRCSECGQRRGSVTAWAHSPR